MRDIDDIRRENMIAESARLGGDASLARELGLDDENRVYQWLRAKPPQRRNMRKGTAREFEKLLGRPSGWLDVDHSEKKQAQPMVNGAAQSDNDLIALHMAVRELTRALVANAPNAARDFAVLLESQATSRAFATDSGVVGEVLRIVELGPGNAANAVQRALQTAFVGQPKPEKRGRSRQA